MLTRILVSFCNVAPGAPMLGVVDFASGSFCPVKLPAEMADFHGITGLTARHGVLYAGVQGRRGEGAASPASLLILNQEDLSFRDRYVFRFVQSVHSILAGDDSLWAVSTGTDEVVRLGLESRIPRNDETVVWRADPGGPRGDIHHLNSIAFLRGNLVVSGFGPKAGPLWSSANNGFITDTVTSETLFSGIDHPHSVMPLYSGLAYCESRTRAVYVDGLEIAGGLPGYVRGLCVCDGSLFIGAGMGRRVSVSTGLVNNRDDPGEPMGQCAAVRLSLGDSTTRDIIDLSAFGTEVYDLLPIG